MDHSKGSSPVHSSNPSLPSHSSSDEVLQKKPKKLTTRERATLVTLCYINLLKYMDRFTIAGTLTEIQCAFGIGDAQGGLLSTAYVVSYMCFSPLFGYLGDRFNRRLIMAIGIAFWSLSTVLGSFMTVYGYFLATRVLVGIGEAMFSTVSPTLISDICVGDTRSNYLMLYYFAIPVGSGLGFVVGAAAANAFGSWTWALRVTPFLAAIAIFLLIVVVREPPRGEAEGSAMKATSWWSDLKYLGTNKSFVLSTTGVTLVTYVSGGVAWWGPKFLTLGLATQQGEDVSYNKVSLVVGFEAAIAGVIGVAAGSLIGQKLRKRYPTADALVCAWGMIVCAPLLFWGTVMADGPPVPTYVVLFFAQCFLNIVWAPNGDIILYTVVPTRRSSAEAFSILISHALGDAGSPYIIGLISDSFNAALSSKSNLKSDISPAIHSGTFPSVYDFRSDSSNNCTGSSFIDPETVVVDFLALQYSLLLTTIIVAVSAFFFFANAWYLEEDKKTVEKIVKANQLSNNECLDHHKYVKVPNELVIFDPAKLQETSLPATITIPEP